MYIIKHKNFFAFFIILVILCVDLAASGLDPNSNVPDSNEPNNPLIRFGSQMKKIDYLVEAAYWPNWDFKNVKGYIAKPNPEKKDKFTKLVTRIIRPNYLPEKLPEKIHFLKGWRGKERESFVLQYEKGPYVIRVKNQVTHVQVTKTRRDSSHRIIIAIQAKDKSVCVDKSSQNSIFKFADQFLCEKINSKAQNYSWIINMDKPAFKQMDGGYFLAYPVGASRPDIDVVCIWTDGHTVLINLKERRKRFFRPTK